MDDVELPARATPMADVEPGPAQSTIRSTSISRKMPRIGTAMVGAVLLLGACSHGNATSGRGAAGSIPAPTPPRQFEQVAVIGTGRAIQAASATGIGALVATTIGVDLIDPSGNRTIVPTAIALPATEIVMAPDGRHAVVSDYTHSELWNLGGLPTLVAKFAASLSATFSADGARLITSTSTQILETTLGSSDPPRVRGAAPPGSEFGAATATPDVSVIASPMSGDGTDLVICMATGTSFVDVFIDPSTKIDRAEVSDDGDHVIMTTTSGDPFAGRLASWNIETNTVDWDMDLGDTGLAAIWDVGSDGRTLLAGDKVLRLIGVDGSTVAEWSNTSERTTSSIVATQRGYVVTSSDGTLSFTDLDGIPRAAPLTAERSLADLESLGARDGVIGVGASGAIMSWTGDGVPIAETDVYRGGPINDVAVSPDGDRIAFASTAGVVTVAEAGGSTPPTELVHAEGNVDSVAFDPHRARLLTGVGKRLSDVSFDDAVGLWDSNDGARIATFGGEGEDVNGCANFRNSVEFSPDGELFAATSHDFTVSVHRADTGELVTTLPSHASSVLDIAFSPTGDRLVTTSDDGTVRVWLVDDFTLLHEYIGPPGGYWSLAFLPDGNSLVVSDLTGALRQIDVSTGAEILAFAGRTSRLGRLSISPDGTLLAAPSDGNTAGIWSTTTGELLTQMAGHDAPVTSTAFSPDGSRLFTGSGDATVRSWNLG